MTGDIPVLGQGELSPDALRAANINPATGLATDYLNHFNEVMMLMEMLPDMPDCAEDVLEWTPVDYCRHFMTSGFKNKELAVAAYQASPEPVRARLAGITQEIEAQVARAQQTLQQTPGEAGCHSVAELATTCLKPLIAAASSAIHGAGANSPSYRDESLQAGVDALFD
ncbi:hypothetical protein [Maricaulis sp.]|uniref:hypothetical protein n=1 Tax=Maricaulis sp. TaxID=1486257 RepID=UPI003A916FFE